MRTTLSLSLLLLGSCSQNDVRTLPDGYARGDNGGDDATPADPSHQDGGASDADQGDRDSPAGDWGMPDGPALLIPAGTRMCTMLSAGDVLDNHPFAARITLVPGPVRLPTGAPSFESTWIQTVELAPDGEEAQPSSPGTFQHTFDGTTDIGQHIFAFQQTFQLDTRVLEVTAQAVFEVRSGEVVDPVKVMDETQIVEDPFTLSVAGVHDGRAVVFSTCTYELFRVMVADIDVQNGDQITLSIRVMNPPCPPGMGCAGGVFMGAIVEALFVRSADQRVATSFFQLGWTAVHHEGGQSYLVIFDQPLGATHGLYMPRTDTGGGPGTAHYLDAGLQILSSEPITDLRYYAP
ncbi:hypothetical protein ACFL6C_02150 [Myxococcota bacterium]